MDIIGHRLSVLATMLVLLVARSGSATDHGITGKRLALRPSRFVIVSRDPAAGMTSVPGCPAEDSALMFSDGAHTRTFALSCAKWRRIGGTFTYRDLAAVAGPVQVQIGANGVGRLRATGHGLGGFPIPSGPATITVLLTIGGHSERYCIAFTGNGTGRALLARNAPAAACPLCGNDIVEAGETCDGGDAAECPGECLPDCSCPPPVCGNNVREGREACDGTDATACPGTCSADCTCASQCSALGDVPACQAFGTVPACTACCDDEECFICAQAFDTGCIDPVETRNCSSVLSALGCDAVCCTPP
jgi:hypothetical protein